MVPSMTNPTGNALPKEGIILEGSMYFSRI
jgi:hypothetical protein